MKDQAQFWSSNIKFLRNRKRLTQEDLAADLTIARSKLAQLESGRIKSPLLDDLVKLAAYFKVSLDTIVLQDLANLPELKLREVIAGNVTGANMRVLATTVDRTNQEYSEVVTIEAKAGYASGYGDPEFVAKLPVFSLPQLPREKKHRMFSVSGDSMRPFPDKMWVLGWYVEDWTAIKAGTLCIVVSRTEGLVFKQVTVEADGLLLASLNSLYKPYTLPFEQILEVWRYHSYMTEIIPAGDLSLEMIAEAVNQIRTVSALPLE